MCTEWRSLVCVRVCVCSRFSFLTVNTVITHAPALCTVLSSLFHSISLYGSMIHTPLYLCTHSLDASVFWRKSAKKEGKNRGMAVFTRRWCSWLLENRAIPSIAHFRCQWSYERLDVSISFSTVERWMRVVARSARDGYRRERIWLQIGNERSTVNSIYILDWWSRTSVNALDEVINFWYPALL